MNGSTGRRLQLALLLWLIAPLCAATPAVESASTATDAGLVTLNFPENLELKALIDYVGRRKGVNFIYDEQLGNKRVTIKTPGAVPADSLTALLSSALRMKGLTMAPTGVPGMMKIEPARSLTSSSVGLGGQAEPESADGAIPAVTRVFELRYASVTRINEVVTPFLSASMANLTPLAELKMVIVTDYADNMERLGDLIALVDQAGPKAEMRFLTVSHIDASSVAGQVNQLLTARGGAMPGSSNGVTVLAQDWANRLAVVGPPEKVDEACDLITTLDEPMDLETRIYDFKLVDPERADRLIKKIIGDVQARRFYRSASERESGLLIVTTTPEIHQRLEALHEKLDRPVAESQNPVRFYKLENARASDVLTALMGIEGDTGLSDVIVDGVDGRDSAAELSSADGGQDGGMSTDRSKSATLRDARVLADESSNTIIVVARPAMHSVYEKLIKRLDVRRPQVHIEATLVQVDTTDGFTLGVEIVSDEDTRRGRLLNFSQFGLTTENDQGSLILKPGVGFNGALLESDIANVVIHALESDGRVKVVSRPSVLINDNATGKLISESEEPYASVNASSTVATTSFAGYSSAGTNIEITPQISEGDYLKLEYAITLSSFNSDRIALGDGAESLPPARQSNTLTSDVTIPNGRTIVIGGLTRENYSETEDRVPLLGRIPLLGALFAHQSTSSRKSTLFVFLRASILRDDKFKDLKLLSRDAATLAELDDEFPTSEPVVVR